MIPIRIQIGDGPVQDLYKAWGFVYLSSDKITAPPLKKAEVSSYAEEAGEHQDSRRVADAFDYSMRMAMEAPRVYNGSVNAKIKAFNAAICTPVAGSNMYKYKDVTIYNEADCVKIVGKPEPIAEPDKSSRTLRYGGMEFLVVEFKVRVNRPLLCEFDITPNLVGEFAEGTVPAQWGWRPNLEWESLAEKVYGGTRRFATYYGGELKLIRSLFSCRDGIDVKPYLKRLDALPPTALTDGDAWFAFGQQIYLESLCEIDMQGITSVQYMFLECRALKSIRVRNTGGVKDWLQFSNNCQACESIATLDFSSATRVERTTFPGSNACKHILIKNLGKSELAVYTIYAPMWGYGSEYNRQSMVDSLLTYSHDRAAAGMETATLQLPMDVLARLTSEELGQIGEKGYTFAPLSM